MRNDTLLNAQRPIKTGFREASKKDPCPICQKPDWCGVSDDGALAVCMRVADGATSGTRNNGNLHVLRERDSRPAYIPPTPTPEKSSLAPTTRRHAVYTALLDGLTLDGRHGDNLLARGLSDTFVAHNLFATVPGQARAAAIVEDLAGRFDLTGVPGFWRERGRWRLVKLDPGILIPVRDVQGRVQGCQVRNDHAAPRYRWLSSRGRDAGASSGAPVHWARPWRAVSTGEAVVTEGALKADVIAEQLDCCVVAVAGVSSFSDGFGDWLREQLPELRSVLIAFDSDWKSNSTVKAALLRLIVTTQTAGLRSEMGVWNAAKGLDDLLTSEGEIHG